MDRKTLTSLAGVLIVLIILVFAVDSLLGGLPGAVTTLYRQEVAGIDTAASQVGRDRGQVEKLLSSHKSFLGPIGEREGWSARFDAAVQRIEEARSTLDKNIKPLIEKDESDDAAKLRTRLQEIRANRMSALHEADAVLARAKKLIEYKEKRAAKVAEAESNYKALESGGLQPLKAKAIQAVADWPDKKADIEARMKVFGDLKTAASESFTVMTEENGKPENQIDFEKLVDNAEAVNSARERFDQSIATTSALLDQLYVSWDKILEDMEIREGYEVEFFHYYKVIKIDREDKSHSEILTQQVSKDVYLRHENDLGMTFESKPKGKYDFEADKQVSPPGYNYVGNSHYGSWQRDSHGQSFWVFYGQYSLMRNLFWGGSYYRPVYRTDWNTYRDSRTRGTTWYGRDTSGKSVYGSKGTMARTKYASSRYTSKGGFSSTQFKKTGGSYRGSRYASRSSRSFSSGSRSSRSSGGK